MAQVNKNYVLSSLCYYDKRNPDCVFDDDEIAEYKALLIKNKIQCGCDNCFYGRTELANELLKYINHD